MPRVSPIVTRRFHRALEGASVEACFSSNYSSSQKSAEERGPRDPSAVSALISEAVVNTADRWRYLPRSGIASRRSVESSRGTFVGTGADSKKLRMSLFIGSAWYISFNLYAPFWNMRRTQTDVSFSTPGRWRQKRSPSSAIYRLQIVPCEVNPCVSPPYCPTHIRHTAFFCSLSRMKLREKKKYFFVKQSQCRDDRHPAQTHDVVVLSDTCLSTDE